MGRVIKKALLQVSDFHFLCPFHSPTHAPVFSGFPFCPFISYLLSQPTISQLFSAPILPLLPITLGSLLQQESTPRPQCDSSSDRCEDASAFLYSQDGFMNRDSQILKNQQNYL